jgi:2-keto-4-pentenoate hydratase/2-oxohepta-3-ene-1,7-dioic acid hydratase in catechol pathway
MLDVRHLRLLVEGRPRFGHVDSERPGEVRLLTQSPFDGGVPDGKVVPLAGQTLLPPTVPSKILGVGTNYRAHAAERGSPIPSEPLLFMKPPSALCAPGQPIVRPRGYERVDFEGELAVVIGRAAHRVRESEALSFVFGYTICNDVTVRDLQKKDGQFTRAKGFDTFCPVGPFIVSGPDPGDLGLKTRVNGELRQDSRTSDLIFSVARVLEVASRVMTLLPGDLITTGTPAGVGPLQPGDVVAVEIERLGVLENPVVDEPPIE